LGEKPVIADMSEASLCNLAVIILTDNGKILYFDLVKISADFQHPGTGLPVVFASKGPWFWQKKGIRLEIG
jgi:hypothetical protein